MSAPRSRAGGSPGEWLHRARSALLLARQRASGIVLEDLCFQAQQAAEKALKAVCLHEEIEFPFTHDVRFLMRHLTQEGIPLPARLRAASVLTDYAVATRYPSAAEPVSEDDYEKAVELAESVVTWCALRIEGQQS